jgi:hypothetical protein
VAAGFSIMIRRRATESYGGPFFRASLGALLALACLGSKDQAYGQRAGALRTTAGEHELSPTVWVTWIGKVRKGALDELILAVLWRGKPYWHKQPHDMRHDEGGISERGVSSDTLPVVTRTVYKIGEVELSREIDWSAMVARINGQPIDLRSTNVVFVDRADTPDSRIVNTLRVKSRLVPGVDFDPEYPSLVRLLMNIPEIRDFAR